MTFTVPAHIKEAFSAFHEKWEVGAASLRLADAAPPSAIGR